MSLDRHGCKLQRDCWEEVVLVLKVLFFLWHFQHCGLSIPHRDTIFLILPLLTTTVGWREAIMMWLKFRLSALIQGVQQGHYIDHITIFMTPILGSKVIGQWTDKHSCPAVAYYADKRLAVEPGFDNCSAERTIWGHFLIRSIPHHL